MNGQAIIKRYEAGERDFRWFNLTEADLNRAHLPQANLASADLHMASLVEANLSGADLQWAILSWTNLSRANLEAADLRMANLTGANLAGANLKGASLRVADLRWAVLAGADLQGADLVMADASDEQLGQAASLEGAIMPDGTLHKWRESVLLDHNWQMNRSRQPGKPVFVGALVWLLIGSRLAIQIPRQVRRHPLAERCATRLDMVITSGRIQKPGLTQHIERANEHHT
jgi:hypothetical protein